MKTLMFPIVWAFTLTLALPAHRPPSAQNCCEQVNRCSRAGNLTALQLRALDAVAKETDSAPPSSRNTGGEAPDIVID